MERISMGQENETVKPEKEPKYRKSAQMFGVAVAVLLCVVLMLDTFKRSGRGEEKEGKPVPIDQETARQSELDFQKRFEQERQRRQRQPESAKSEAQKISETTALLENQRDIKLQAADSGQGQTERVSVEEEWREQERRRALNARLSRFGMKKASENLKLNPAKYPKQPMPNSKDQSTIIAEQTRVKNEIMRLRQMQQGAKPRSTGVNFVQIQEQEPQEESFTVGRPRSEAQPQPGQKLIATGTVMSAVLDQELISDYVGPFRALATHDVYDVTEKYIIIPKGSRITGRSLLVTNVNEPIQARMGLTVRWLVLPNGKRISFEKRVAALDQAGVPAIKDKVNYHLIAQFLGVAAYALLSAETSRSGTGFDSDRTFAGDVGGSLREQFAPLAAKYLNLVPTITLRTGTPLKIFFEDDIYAYPWEALRNRLFKAHRSDY
jgi:type IV secretion system protein VirB10